DGNVTVVVNDLAGGTTVGPIRVLFIDGTTHLRKVGAGHHANISGVTGANDLSQAIPLQKRASKVKGETGRIAGDDTGGIDHEHRGLEGLEIGHHLFSANVDHVDLTQVGLDLAPGPVFPPIGHERLLV